METHVFSIYRLQASPKPEIYQQILNPLRLHKHPSYPHANRTTCSCPASGGAATPEGQENIDRRLLGSNSGDKRQKMRSAMGMWKTDVQPTYPQTRPKRVLSPRPLYPSASQDESEGHQSCEL